MRSGHGILSHVILLSLTNVTYVPYLLEPWEFDITTAVLQIYYFVFLFLAMKAHPVAIHSYLLNNSNMI